tara:strand:+ start:118 stop:231 length:114 start_codon:yes stop_codon:yes gene_type:complete
LATAVEREMDREEEMGKGEERRIGSRMEWTGIDGESY